MKNKFWRLFLIAVSALLIIMPFDSVFAEEGGSFYLMAATQSKMIIAPAKIEYEEGMTIREALIASEYDFESIESGFIYAIEGYSAGFSLFYDGGGCSLEENADKITALAFMEGGEYYVERYPVSVCGYGYDRE